MMCAFFFTERSLPLGGAGRFDLLDISKPGSAGRELDETPTDQVHEARRLLLLLCVFTLFHAILVASHVTLHVAVRLLNRLQKKEKSKTVRAHAKIKFRHQGFGVGRGWRIQLLHW